MSMIMSMILLETWLAASLLFGACWALVGLLLGEQTEADPTVVVPEVSGEPA